MHDVVYSKKKNLFGTTIQQKHLEYMYYFHSQIQKVLELNFKPRIKNAHKDIKNWKKHKLTTTGNITVFKS